MSKKFKWFIETDARVRRTRFFYLKNDNAFEGRLLDKPLTYPRVVHHRQVQLRSCQFIIDQERQEAFLKKETGDRRHAFVVGYVVQEWPNPEVLGDPVSIRYHVTETKGQFINRKTDQVLESACFVSLDSERPVHEGGYFLAYHPIYCGSIYESTNDVSEAT